MTTTNHKRLMATAAVALFAGVFAAVYGAQPLAAFLPVMALAVLGLLQYPRLLFFALLASVPWSAEIQFGPTLGTDLPDEPLMLLAAFAALVLWLAKPKAAVPFRFHPLLLLLGAGFAWLLVTVALSSYPLYSLKYLAAKGWYLLAFVALPLLLRFDEKDWKRAAVVLVVSMLAVTAVVLVRQASRGFAFAHVNDALQPFFRNHVNYSALLVMTVPLLVAFLKQTARPALRRVLWALLLLAAAGVVLSYSRGAWLAAAAGLPAFWLIKKGWLFKSFVVLLIAVAVGFAWLQHEENYLRFAPDHDTTVFHHDFGEHLAATYKGRDVSTAERFYRWVAGVHMAQDKWLTGFGPATFYPTYRPYTVPLFRTWVSNNPERSTVHNYFLLLAIEQGLPGLLLFVLLLGALFWYAQRAYHHATDPFWKTAAATAGVLLLMQCTVNFLSDLVETDKVGSVFYLCVALVLTAAGKTQPEPKVPAPID